MEGEWGHGRMDFENKKRVDGEKTNEKIRRCDACSVVLHDRPIERTTTIVQRPPLNKKERDLYGKIKSNDCVLPVLYSTAVWAPRLRRDVTVFDFAVQDCTVVRVWSIDCE
jgi:ribosomal protein L34E